MIRGQMLVGRRAGLPWRMLGDSSPETGFREFPEFRTKTEFSDLAVGYSALKLELFRLRDAQANYGTVIALIDSGIDSGAIQMGKAKGFSGLSDGAHRART